MSSNYIFADTGFLIVSAHFCIISLISSIQKVPFFGHENPTRYFAAFFSVIYEIFVVLIHQFGRQGIWVPNRQSQVIWPCIFTCHSASCKQKQALHSHIWSSPFCLNSRTDTTLAFVKHQKILTCGKNGFIFWENKAKYHWPEGFTCLLRLFSLIAISLTPQYLLMQVISNWNEFWIKMQSCQYISWLLKLE